MYRSPFSIGNNSRWTNRTQTRRGSCLLYCYLPKRKKKKMYTLWFRVARGGLGEKSGPGVTVRPAHSIHGARPSQGWINERAYRAQAQGPMSSGGP